LWAPAYVRTRAVPTGARAGIGDARGNKLESPLNIHVGLAPIISLLAGILILAMPKLLNYIVAIYLIVIGLIGLFGGGAMRI
jgi:Protein of unknown function (DUF3096)